MRRPGAVLLLTAYSVLGQTGQQRSRPEWPCVPGRAVDPAYLEASESTGGQILLFQKSEIAQAGLFVSAEYTHPATVARAVGTLSGARDFEFPVDSTMQSLLVMASIQCRIAIGVFRPGGTEMIAANSTQSVDLQAGRGLKIDNPEAGKWKVRLEGTGLFVLSARAQSPVRLSAVGFFDGDHRAQPRLGVGQTATVHISGELTAAAFQLLGPSGDLISTSQTAEPIGSAYRFPITLAAERFRIRMTGVDASGWPIQRVYPVLFRALPPN